METKFLQFKTEVDEEGVISGYASRFNMVDQGGDRIAPGAYTKSLKERQPVMLWQHDPAQPIGVWEANEDDEGLFVKGRIATGMTSGRDAYEAAKAGVVQGLSIGYRTKQASRDGNVRILEEVELHEISLVTFPMQKEATIDSVKSDPLVQLKRQVEKAARDAGFSAWQQKAAAAAAAAKLGDGLRDAAADEVRDALRDAFKL